MAEQGDALAQHNLGNLYHDDHGVPQDYKEAFSWYRKAAEQRVVFAQYNLGVVYEKGRGITQDYKKP